MNTKVFNALQKLAWGKEPFVYPGSTSPDSTDVFVELEPDLYKHKKPARPPVNAQMTHSYQPVEVKREDDKKAEEESFQRLYRASLPLIQRHFSGPDGYTPPPRGEIEKFLRDHYNMGTRPRPALKHSETLKKFNETLDGFDRMLARINGVVESGNRGTENLVRFDGMSGSLERISNSFDRLGKILNDPRVAEDRKKAAEAFEQMRQAWSRPLNFRWRW